MTNRIHWIVAVCTAALLTTGCGEEERPVPVRQAKRPVVRANESWPNVVLISVSSLRPDHLKCYGYSKDTSPHIDRLAAEGALFENVISSSSWSLPAHGAMFTGLCDSVHGCTEADRRLHEDHYTLAERLRDVGYTTTGFFSGPFLHPAFGMSQGFETYADCMWRPSASAETKQPDVTSPQIVDQVQGWLQKNTRRPFFMFVQMWDPHFDFTPPPPYDTKFDPDYRGEVTGERFLLNPAINKNMPPRDLEHLGALYDGEIAWTDDHLGRILDELESLKLLDSSIVILVSDHGTALLEHGLRGHRNSLFDEVIRIPLIIRYPAIIEGGQRFGQQARIIDLLPTVIALLGMPADFLMGQTLTPLFSGQKLERREPAVSELLSMGFKLQSFRVAERKTIWNLDPDAGSVYDLRSDPGELAAVNHDSPVSTAATADIKWCRLYLKEFGKRSIQSPKTPELPPELLEKFAAMGYVAADPQGGLSPGP